jgi:ABC-2 type transport system ATP-binding protein
MTQRFSFYEDLSVAENLDFVARMYAVRDRRRAIGEVIDRHRFAGQEGKLAGQLSGGWKQRLALAACLVHRPELLLLDEPTAGVDPKARREFWDEIHHLAGSGLTVLITTHYMDEAERCHRLAYIAAGRLLARGTVAEVVHQAGLTTWAVRGPDLLGLADRLRRAPAVRQAVAFGNMLHVSGDDAAALDRATTPFRNPPYDWQRIEPGLEDVFIHLMDRALEGPSP